MYRTRFWTVIVFLSFMLIGLPFSCYKGEKGCTDPEAKNFDANADDNCASCCRYYQLIVHLNPKWADMTGDSVFAYNKTLFLTRQDSVNVSGFPIYLSDIHLVSATGDSTGVKGRLRLTNSGTSFVVENNFALTEPSIPYYTIGRPEKNGQYTRVHLKVGLDPAIANADSVSLPASHPLSPTLAQQMYNAPPNGIANFKLSVYTLPDSTYQVFKATGSDLTAYLDLPLPAPVTIAGGSDHTLELYVHYERLFLGVNFRGSSQAVIQKIVRNIPSAFSFTP